MYGRSVEVKIELGHKAILKDQPTAEGYTHDWTVFVKGPEGCKIENFVEKVIFLLHESFPKSKRTIREPPFQVSFLFELAKYLLKKTFPINLSCDMKGMCGYIPWA